MLPSSTRIGVVVFLSGFCSLVYQVTWLRLLRLIFGSSTLSTAVVLAIFMGGLGFGGLLLGRRTARARSPLAFYAAIELGIAVSAAASPVLVWVARELYLGLGGVGALGPAGATALRLVLSVVVLGVPATLMGGTLPAVAQAMERPSDRGRRIMATLYSVNTLGAVAGAVATTFVLIELLGVRQSLWLAAAINLLLGMSVRRMSRRGEEGRADPGAAEDPVEQSGRGDRKAAGAASAGAASDASTPQGASASIVLLAAFLVGFVFFLMEIVWYRMLGPILGGTLFTFGLILSVALVGIGLGGWLYSRGDRDRRPTLQTLALTCGLEALLLIVPFALGDRLAHFALVIRSLSAQGFGALALGWTLVAALVVLPTAVVAGYQFPQLVALLGAGRQRVGPEVGLAYAWNTWGAILGSLVGAFLLLPWLSEPWLWRASTVTLAVLALALVLAASRHDRRARRRLGGRPVGCAALALLLCLAPGPSAFWRHSGIGAGRADTLLSASPDELRSKILLDQASVISEAEGVESSVALLVRDDLALYINGKIDGAAGDAPATIMLGMVGAFLHPAPRKVMVVGLGSGMTAGWLAAVPEVEQVDVVELEPAVAEMARAYAPMTFSVTESPKVRLSFGDGREAVRTGSETYDLIVSEPSNPYRHGVADLFSRDFYLSVEKRLAAGGIYAHWLQGYEVDPEVVGISYATLLSVFPHVESWHVSHLDLLLVASREPLIHDTDRIRRRASREPYRQALLRAWRVSGLEGFYSGFLGHPQLARLAAEGHAISHDDRPIIEFGFARNMGRRGLFEITDLQKLARVAAAERPIEVRGGPIDWKRVRESRESRLMAGTYHALRDRDAGEPDARRRWQARLAYEQRDLDRAGKTWAAQGEAPTNPFDRLLWAEALSTQPRAEAGAFLSDLAAEAPTEAALLTARWRWIRGERESAAEHLAQGLAALATDPWVYEPIVETSLDLAVEMAARDAAVGSRLFALLERPFAVYRFDESRRNKLLQLAFEAGFAEHCGRAFDAFERHVPWQESFLATRWTCFERIGDPRAAAAREQLEEYYASSSRPLFDPSRDPSDLGYLEQLLKNDR